MNTKLIISEVRLKDEIEELEFQFDSIHHSTPDSQLKLLTLRVIHRNIELNLERLKAVLN